MIRHDKNHTYRGTKIYQKSESKDSVQKNKGIHQKQFSQAESVPEEKKGSSTVQYYDILGQKPSKLEA